MANQVHVGGDYLTLCTLAQEESLIKRTNLLASLIRLDGVKLTNNPSNPYQYALSDCLGFDHADQNLGFGEFTCLYSPDITVSHLENDLEQPLNIPFDVNIISSAAYNLSNISQALSSEIYLAGTVLKIINQRRTAKPHHQRHLVLGAFGCGAFGNEPDFIANIYRSAIDALEFIGCFDSISFAVTQKQLAGYYDAFFQVFDNALSAPAKPLFNTLMPIFKAPEVPEAHPILQKMLRPFFKISTQEELIHLALRLITKEILSLHVKPNNTKKAFLNDLLEQLTQRTGLGQEILEDALSAPEISAHYPSSKFFKAEPAFLSELKRLLLWHTTVELTIELFTDDDCCGTDIDSGASRGSHT